MADDYRARKAAELLEKQRLARVAKNLAEGRTGRVEGLPAYDKALRSAASPQEAMQALRDQGKVTNLENVIKSTGTDTIGIDPAVRNKSKFFNLDKKLGGASDVLDDVSHVASEEGGILKNQKGFSKMLPMLGMGAAGLAALGIAGKVQAGEYGDAALDTADVATDYIPFVGQAKMIARPSDLGNAELPPEMMEEREVYNAARRAKNGETVNNPSTEQPLLAPEDRATYEDMKKKVNFNVLNRIK